MRQRIVTSMAAASALLAVTPANAQDSVTVDTLAELVESPATFEMHAVAALNFGQIALPRYSTVSDSACNYWVWNPQADGSGSLQQYDHSDGSTVPNGTADSNGCYAVGDVHPAKFRFSCDSVDVVFAFSYQSAVNPEWEAILVAGETGRGVGHFYAIGQAGTPISTSNDVAAYQDPYGLNCTSAGAGVYDLYAGGKLQLRALVDHTTATLGQTFLGTITVDAIY
jgi:hypothetical protein